MSEEYGIVFPELTGTEDEPGAWQVVEDVRSAIEGSSVTVEDVSWRDGFLALRMRTISADDLYRTAGLLQELLGLSPGELRVYRLNSPSAHPVHTAGGTALREFDLLPGHSIGAGPDDAVRDLPDYPVKVGKADRSAASGRRMDVAVSRDGAELPRGSALQPAAEYAVHARIGRPFDVSILDGEVESIDDVVGPGPRRLAITLVSDDLAILDGSARPLDLEPEGPSETVAFTVRTPDEVGAVRARLSVFLEGNLVQTFSITGWVGDPMRTDGLQARCEHLSADAYVRLQRVRPRIMSVVQDPQGGGRLQLRTRLSTEQLPTTVLEERAGLVRTRLEEAIRHRNRVDDVLRELAIAGREMFDALYNLDPAHATDPEKKARRAELRQLRRREGETIQITRMGIHTSFPWTAVYDWRLPADPGAAPVCRQEGCGHTADEGDAVCLRGFWGIRHCIDEVIGDPTGFDPVPVPLGDRRPAVLLAVGVPDDGYVDGLRSDLAQVAAPRGVLAVTSPAELLDRLWDSATRPPVAVVLGHHTWVAGAPGDRRARIDVNPEGEWLDASKIVERSLELDQGDWSPPQPIVMLLACESSAVRPSDLNSFLATLYGVGAAAIIGAECTIFSGSAATFATTVLRGLLGAGGEQPAPLAEAVRAARRQLAYGGRGDLSGLAITAVGSADLVLSPA